MVLPSITEERQIQLFVAFVIATTTFAALLTVPGDERKGFIFFLSVFCAFCLSCAAVVINVCTGNRRSPISLISGLIVLALLLMMNALLHYVAAVWP